MLLAFWHGFMLALALILPIGPQNAFVLNQGTRSSIFRVLPTIITAALSDTLLIILAVGGVAAVVVHWRWFRVLLAAAGTLFLFVMGLHTWRGMVEDDGESPHDIPWRTQVRHSLSVSLLNPHAVMDTVVILGGQASLYRLEDVRWAFSMGAILVSWLWFMGLALFGRVLISRKRQHVRPLLGKISALLMWFIAVQTLWQLVREWMF
ncbi:LysE/ArgO family amino acid transporter [Sulfobacillus thermosulfidooxidans]|uniref:LysE/ArgO family amino acid transporter n=1 Tax=Sulfobacillus thermosulfidooxidans TaxID=28034 RepID=UPI0006B581E8|nr:LysE family transporter [Sulfobacillus thermosulfidooxidans]